MKIIVAFLVLAVAALAQSHYNYFITITDSNNVPGTTYNIYRIDGPCPAVPAWTAPLANSTVPTYADFTVVDGKTYCFMVRALLPGVGETPDSNVASVTLPPWPLNPVSITGKVKLTGGANAGAPVTTIRRNP